MTAKQILGQFTSLEQEKINLCFMMLGDDLDGIKVTLEDENIDLDWEDLETLAEFFDVNM